MFFAELGARVIKVEDNRSGGDVTRQWKTEKEDAATAISSYFSSVNWGKESIALDLSTKKGQAIAFQLAEQADIILTSFKAGDAEKLGLDYERVKNKNPGVLYGAITGFGPDDPRVGYDAIIQAEAGFTFMNGQPDGPPVKMPVALMDLLAAHQLKEGLLTAIIRQQQTGEGQKITTSLIHSGISSLVNQATNWLVGGKIPQRAGSEHPNIVPYGTIFYAKDDKPLVVAIGSNQQFTKFCKLLGEGELAEDPRFISNQNRVKHRKALNETLKQAIGKWHSQDLVDQLQTHHIPVGRVLNMEEVLRSPEAQDLLLHSDQLQGLKTIAFQGTIDAQNAQLSPPPNLSSHAEPILRNDLNFKQTEVDNLVRKSITR